MISGGYALPFFAWISGIENPPLYGTPLAFLGYQKEGKMTTIYDLAKRYHGVVAEVHYNREPGLPTYNIGLLTTEEEPDHV